MMKDCLIGNQNSFSFLQIFVFILLFSTTIECRMFWGGHKASITDESEVPSIYRLWPNEGQKAMAMRIFRSYPNNPTRGIATSPLSSNVPLIHPNVREVFKSGYPFTKRLSPIDIFRGIDATKERRPRRLLDLSYWNFQPFMKFLSGGIIQRG